MVEILKGTQIRKKTLKNQMKLKIERKLKTHLAERKLEKEKLLLLQP